MVRDIDIDTVKRSDSVCVASDDKLGDDEAVADIVLVALTARDTVTTSDAVADASFESEFRVVDADAVDVSDMVVDKDTVGERLELIS